MEISRTVPSYNLFDYVLGDFLDQYIEVLLLLYSIINKISSYSIQNSGYKNAKLKYHKEYIFTIIPNICK